LNIVLLLSSSGIRNIPDQLINLSLTPMNNQKLHLAITILLAVALIIVTGLYIQEKNKPDTLASFSQELSSKQANMKTACADVTTDEKREECKNALEEVSDLLTSATVQK
jgi:hypothetical protein